MCGVGTRAGSATSGVSAEQLASAQAQVREMSTHLEGLEKERDFYFAKVRHLNCYGSLALISDWYL